MPSSEDMGDLLTLLGEIVGIYRRRAADIHDRPGESDYNLGYADGLRVGAEDALEATRHYLNSLTADGRDSYVRD